MFIHWEWSSFIICTKVWCIWPLVFSSLGRMVPSQNPLRRGIWSLRAENSFQGSDSLALASKMETWDTKRVTWHPDRQTLIDWMVKLWSKACLWKFPSLHSPFLNCHPSCWSLHFLGCFTLSCALKSTSAYRPPILKFDCMLESRRELSTIQLPWLHLRSSKYIRTWMEGNGH